MQIIKRNLFITYHSVALSRQAKIIYDTAKVGKKGKREKLFLKFNVKSHFECDSLYHSLLLRILSTYILPDMAKMSRTQHGFFLVERQFLSVKPQKALGKARKWMPRVNSQKIVSVLNHGGTMGAAQPLEHNLLHINIRNTSYNIHSLCCHIVRYNLCR